MAEKTLQLAGTESHVKLQVSSDQDGIRVDVGARHFVFQARAGEQPWLYEPETGAVIPYFIWQNGEEVQLWIEGRVYHLTAPTAQSGRQQVGAKRGQHAGDIKAPMPGSILKVLVEAGQTVEANTPVVIMESMKMEMTLTTPGKGVIKAIQCQPGQMVEMNAILVQMAPEDA